MSTTTETPAPMSVADLIEHPPTMNVSDLVKTMKLHTAGAPILKQVSQPVPEGVDVGPILDKMREIMYGINKSREGTGSTKRGIGIAAPQCGVPFRIIIIDVPNGIGQELINPVFVKRSGGRVNVTEGCLSYPGRQVRMLRYKNVIIEGWDRDWNKVRRKAKGLNAVCFQHEVDHLNGVTIG